MPPKQPVAAPAPEAPFLTFPPFPDLPSDCTLPPFKDFKASGIQIFGGDDETELDGLGIPTAELRVKHDTDESKTGKKKGKKRGKATRDAASNGEPVKRLTWWEEWEEGEDLRVSSSGYPLALAPVDRLFKASRDFVEVRRWPPIISGVRAFWDQYRLYVGLLVTPSVFRKPLANSTNNKRTRDAADEELSDDEISAPAKSQSDVQVAPNEGENLPRRKLRRPRPDSKDDENEDDDDDDDEDDDVAMDRKKVESEEFKEERLAEFLNDPERSVQVFLSSYMREQGLIWTDRNLQTGPRLTAFFINFLLRNRVLPESNIERGLRRALEITTLAKKELPLTAKVGRTFPDDISVGLRECFGRKTGGTLQMDSATLEAWSKGDTEVEEEREVKRLKAANDGDADIVMADNNATGEEPKVDEFEAELKATNVEVIPADTLPSIEKEIIDDNIAMDVDLATNQGWGTSDNDWGTDNPGWGKSAEDPGKIATGESSAWPTAEDPWSAWGGSKKSTLMKLMGLTVLPLTHTTGIVEQSTRRIKSIVPPPQIPAKSVSGTGDGEDPEGVEEELEKRFAKVVLEPWVGEDNDDIRRPIIRSTSKGAVAPGSLMEDGTTVEGDLASESKLHNPLKSDITLLIEPRSAELMSVGMGLFATWIQVVRQEEKKISGDAIKPKKRKKGKKVPKGYWYLEELLVTFVSFYTQEKLLSTA